MSEAAQPVRRPRRRRTSSSPVVGVLGEILITIGILILLFLGWQLWFNNVVSTATQTATADELSQEWEATTSTPDPDHSSDPGEPVVMDTPPLNEAFANLIVPRLGLDYKRPIAEGVGTSVLNNTKLGMGHYTGTQLPGAVGNFALASHRSAYGGAFHNIHQLRVGDSIYVETADGWYRYVFRDMEYVKPSAVGVILPVPQHPEAVPTDRLITLTTCNPFYSSAERIIAYGVFDSWYPRAGGPPPEISQIATAAGVN
jgi:sortase A